MSLILILIVVAMVLVAFEVVLPGGILGVIAGICVVAATVLSHIDYGAWVAVAVFFGSGLLIFALIMIEFKLLKNTSLGNAFFLKETVTGHTGPTTEVSLIGKEGVALTRLNPSGRVIIDGNTYEASSQDGYMDAKQAITVVAQKNFKLTIKKR
ncbi:MAG: membrane-bound ClpP family serine protease [Cryomorphaceae bacterium]|jgi:membrane-bound ClpP family serine protease